MDTTERVKWVTTIHFYHPSMQTFLIVFVSNSFKPLIDKF